MMGNTDCFGASEQWRGMMGNYPMMGMMMSNHGMMGGRGFGPGMMMQGWTPPSDLLPPSGETLSLEGAEKIAEAYIASWEDENLALAEVMQFDNHFYAEAQEVDSGRSAFEFLIDPTDGSVFPEPGPNMMWNLRYGMHANLPFGMMGMGTAPNVSGVEMTVTPEQATDYAQAFLDELNSGLTAGDEAEAFYGYYTLHVLENGQVAGMLSVNGYTGQVWLHQWHGKFITMTEEEHE
jgi:hypothetical protein